MIVSMNRRSRLLTPPHNRPPDWYLTDRRRDPAASAPSLRSSACQVWWARPSDASARLAALLDADERQRWSALRRLADRNRFVVACGLTRLVLATHLGRSPAEISIARACPQCGTPHGKPQLAHPPPTGPLEFSISHSGSRVVVALAHETPVGVDVERVRPELPVDELAPDVLTPLEGRTIRDLAGEERTLGFFVYWTRKEAVLKATGRGLGLPLRSFAVSGPREPARLVVTPESGPALVMSLHDLDPGNGYVACLAVLGQCRHVVVRDGSALIAAWSTGPMTFSAGSS